MGADTPYEAVCIAANMRRMKGVDDKKPAHVQAYLVARQQTARPRAETVLAIAKSQGTKFNASARMTSKFVLAPRSTGSS